MSRGASTPAPSIDAVEPAAFLGFSAAAMLGVIVTRDGRIEDCDEALLASLGYSREDVVGRAPESLVAADCRERVAAHLGSGDESWYHADILDVHGAPVAALVVPNTLTIAGMPVRVTLLIDRTPMAEAKRQLEGALDGIVSALVSAIEARDPYTAGHQQRAAHLASLIGRELGLGETALQRVVAAALVHDIGKIGVPVEILTRPSRPKPSEWLLIKEHPAMGETILGDVDLPWDIAPVVRHHHERLDGSGYPDGLAGDAIPLDVRIVATADALDAIAGVRPYHRARTLAEAIGLLEAESNKYAPETVAAVRSLERRGALAGLEFTDH